MLIDTFFPKVFVRLHSVCLCACFFFLIFQIIFRSDWRCQCHIQYFIWRCTQFVFIATIVCVDDRTTKNSMKTKILIKGRAKGKLKMCDFNGAQFVCGISSTSSILHIFSTNSFPVFSLLFYLSLSFTRNVWPLSPSYIFTVLFICFVV